MADEKNPLEEEKTKRAKAFFTDNDPVPAGLHQTRARTQRRTNSRRSSAKSKQNSNEIKPLWRPKKKITLDNIIEARGCLNEAYERARNLKDVNDKLTILKDGYFLATQVVPNVTKPKKQWHLYDVDDYQDAVSKAREINLLKVHPDPNIDAILKGRQKAIVKFESLRNKNGLVYMDGLILLDEKYHALNGISVLDFSEYILPYKQYLQQEFMKQNGIRKIIK